MEIDQMSLVADENPAAVAQSGDEAFDLPPAFVSAQHSLVLGCRPPAALAVGRDQLHCVLRCQPFVQGVAVLGPVSNEALGSLGDEALVEALLHQFRLVGRGAGHRGAQGQAIGITEDHDLGALALLGFADARAPFFAAAKVPSMNPSWNLSFPASRAWAPSASSTRRRVPSRLQRWSQR